MNLGIGILYVGWFAFVFAMCYFISPWFAFLLIITPKTTTIKK
ncbi:unknown [Eubacterium sp. CAG:786]|nr:unknown [Eubacterium sp. CAG:786]